MIDVLVGLLAFVIFVGGALPPARRRALLKACYIYGIVMLPDRRWHLPAFLSSKIHRGEPVLAMPGRTLKPDLYRPADTGATVRRPAVIVYAPLAPQGKRNKHVVNLLEGLTRAGLVVIVPHWPARPLGLIDDADVQELEETIEFLAKQPYVDPDRIGIIAVSYGAGPALIAASRPGIGKRLHYVMSFGGYVDLWSVFHFAGSGKTRVGAEPLDLSPHPYMHYIILRALSRWLPNKRDRAALTGFLHTVEDVNAPIDLDQVQAMMSPKGQALIESLQQASSMSAKQLRAQFPAEVREKADKLTVNSSMLDDIDAKVMIIHTTNDNLVPYSEATKLWKHLRADQRQHWTTLSGFEHTIPPALNLKNLFTIYLPNMVRLLTMLYEFFLLQEPAAEAPSSARR